MTEPEIPEAEAAVLLSIPVSPAGPAEAGLTETELVETELVEPAAEGHPSWRSELLARPNAPGLPTVGIWRVYDAGRSAILKLLRAPTESSAWAGHPDPAHPFHWRREAEAFARLAAYLDDAAPERGDRSGIRMPHCYGVFDRVDGAVAIWMEDVRGTPASSWDLPRFGRFAGQLAGFHRSPVAGTAPRSARTPASLPGWLSHEWLRTYVGRRDPVGQVLADQSVWRHPAVREVLDVGRAEEFLTLWRRRYDYLSEVEAQPAVLCHLDVHPFNLFDTDGDTVLIDWAFCGVGGSGEDLGTLAVDAIADFHLESDQISPLFEILVSNYTAASTGYDEATVRRAVASAALARYAWLIPALIAALVEGRERINGRPSDQAAPVWAAVCHFLLDLAAQR